MERGPLGPMEPRVPFPTCRLSASDAVSVPAPLSVPAFPLLQALGVCQRPLKQCLPSALFRHGPGCWDLINKTRSLTLTL